MGLGLRELKIILNAIKEIAAENNNISPLTPRDYFIEFLEKKYDIKLRAKIQEQQQKNQNMQPSRTFYRKTTTAFPNTSEEQNDQLDDDNNSDERYGSGDDHLL